MSNNKINISIDDVSPHLRSSASVIDKCYMVLDKFPDAKFTLFIPTAYWRTIGDTATKQPLYLYNDKFFCQFLKSLPKETFELCYHGYHHGVKDKSNNDEFLYLNQHDAHVVIEKMVNVVKHAGLFDDFKMIVRPPAWRMNKHVFDACIKFGFHTFALSNDEYAIKTYDGNEKKVKSVMYNCCPPFKPLKLFDKTEIVYHACEWDKNYLSVSHVNDLLQFLTINEGKYVFSFISEL